MACDISIQSKIHISDSQKNKIKNRLSLIDYNNFLFINDINLVLEIFANDSMLSLIYFILEIDSFSFSNRNSFS